MAKIITVKGVGKASARPDYVVLSMSLEAHNMNVLHFCLYEVWLIPSSLSMTFTNTGKCRKILVTENYQLQGCRVA